VHPKDQIGKGHEIVGPLERDSVLVAQVVDPADAVFSRLIGLDPSFVPTCL